jgi:hypothetical protein
MRIQKILWYISLYVIPEKLTRDIDGPGFEMVGQCNPGSYIESHRFEGWLYHRCSSGQWPLLQEWSPIDLCLVSPYCYCYNHQRSNIVGHQSGTVFDDYSR